MRKVEPVNRRVKHCDIQYHFVLDVVQNKTVQLQIPIYMKMLAKRPNPLWEVLLNKFRKLSRKKNMPGDKSGLLVTGKCCKLSSVLPICRYLRVSDLFCMGIIRLSKCTDNYVHVSLIFSMIHWNKFWSNLPKFRTMFNSVFQIDLSCTLLKNAA